MNLALDIGNSFVKWAFFEGRALESHGRLERGEAAGWLRYNRGRASRLLAAASGDASGLGVELLGPATPLPIGVDYSTPATLGADRVAAGCGAAALHPGDDCLVIDAGTCITVDYVGGGVFMGGAIMPGLDMSLLALHTGTARLPLLSPDGRGKSPLLGRSTEECIVAGTLGATMLALAGFIAAYRSRRPGLRVLLTGGDAHLLVDAGATAWEQQPLLTLIGLNEIILHNE